eukprot:TRINITY_DN73725_c0_g1_i1.p1 TRINITY_DN73725_c0_g1~~TRINITY_DN73725_c0_g1_i1.p1  ORF type:complete len:293 (-),score=28.53 TRINITY_DN73725_c0_g1_i1:71-949(-)
MAFPKACAWHCWISLVIAWRACATCANEKWLGAPARCHMEGDEAIVRCEGPSSTKCGTWMKSRFKVGAGVHPMRIKAAPGAGVVTTYYLSNNGGLYDKSCSKPWVEIDFEIMGLQAHETYSRIWTNLFTGACQEHNAWIQVPFDVSTDYHTYAFHVTATNLSWLVDGVTYRTVDLAEFQDVATTVHAASLEEFISVWGRSSTEPGEGIPAFRDGLGVLDRNVNSFPVNAGYVRGCADAWRSCSLHRCCTGGLTCYEKDGSYAQCRDSCMQGIHDEESSEFRTPWTCRVLSTV